MSEQVGLGEERCRNCKLFWKNTGQYLLNDCGTFDTDDNAPCELNPSWFSSCALKKEESKDESRTA